MKQRGIFMLKMTIFSVKILPTIHLEPILNVN